MKKPLQFLLFTFIAIQIHLNLFSQGIEKDQYDEFEKMRIVESEVVPIYKGAWMGMTYLFRFVAADTNMIFMFKISDAQNKVFAVSKGEGMVILKFDDSTFVRFTNEVDVYSSPAGGSDGMLGGNTQGVTLMIKLTNEHKEILNKVKKLQKVRVYTNKGIIEFDVSESKSKLIIENFQIFYKTVLNLK